MNLSIPNRICRAFVASSALLFLCLAANAQQPAALSDPHAARNVHIKFVPPPLEGTISLGIYDSKGKLVRVLHRESGTDEFEVGNDSLGTTWDGRNDADEPLAAGKYHARGYAVGDLDIEGIGFYFNDWISDERPERIEKICAIAAEGDQLLVSAKLEGSAAETLICDSDGKVVSTRAEDAPAKCDRPAASDEAPATATGKDKTKWAIERSSADSPNSEVRQYSQTGELLRRLRIPPEDPQPVAIAASLSAERIFLLEENAAMQRLRGLTLLETKQGAGESISDWKVDFENKIIAHGQFGIANGEPMAAGGSPAPHKVLIKLQPNPLSTDPKPTVELSVATDADGSFLQTPDGLPLQTVSDTPHLRRVLLAPRGDKAVDVFQDGGAVVEQFRVSGLDAMMAFDCGEIELK